MNRFAWRLAIDDLNPSNIELSGVRICSMIILKKLTPEQIIKNDDTVDPAPSTGNQSANP